MSAGTAIEWCDFTFCPWWGCEKVSPGCAHCYANTFARRLGHGTTRPKLWGPGSERKVASDSYWREPLKWNRAAEKAGKRARVFCASMADVFEDREDLRVPRARLAMLIAQTPSLDWLLLTKRPENADRLWRLAWGGGLLPPHAKPWLPNIWLGTTCEDQQRADERIPHLLATPARVRFLSCEPLLEGLDLRPYLPHAFNREPHCTWCEDCIPATAGMEWWKATHEDCHGPFVDWVIVGGESGPGARPFDLAWARSILDQCKAAGVPFFMKQMGSNPRCMKCGNAGYVYCGGAATECPECESWGAPDYRDPKGGDPNEWPDDLQVREFPEVRHD